ncbi:uracil phosphoribosyltransferase [Methanoplanus sp. FWC-SCC4]|uniref:Uracil phosphoribosyltransferase n=1 Tax=Methanochimaera problematica TaxID=2609417 RepID=A0AA97I3V7_9EURY|nr:uracil phosphoribosyltransferase [Methanoplanus sp. FWC-SCC4]WOF17098.1 uracil phosphoribosyltransferase [Methanoplanus sp. FWC-SCC4]
MAVIKVSHPLVTHKLGMLRNIDTNSKDFRELVTELTNFLTYEVTKDCELEKTTIPGWEGKPVEVQKLAGIDPSIVPIFRAGIGMQEGFLKVIPTAKISYVGYYRDESTLQPKLYYAKLATEIHQRRVYVLDPMLATGGTTSAVCKLLKKQGCKDIKVLCILAAPEGLSRMEEDHPDVDIMPAVIDDHLNEKGYIVPGLGDAGDRLFGTK